MLLLVMALLITLPLPITVSLMSGLDWGPVVAGYLAALLLGASYLAIGLFVSARSDNQIVSLIVACALCALLYLLGSPLITDLMGQQGAHWLKLLGSGSRFESITRGVIDLRDLYYYLSLVLLFLALNCYVLERERWVKGKGRAHHKTWGAVTALLIVNALGANLWLGQLNTLRIDMTAGKQFSISPATKGTLAQLQEPLLIRGYFSSKTHPLLAPLVPQLEDLIEEYGVAGGRRVKVEFVDPVQQPELEEEANQKYGIKPVPFQVADRYQSSIVSSYFNVLIQYGDQHEVLGFRDLIEVKARSESDIDVQLRNPEHDLTRAIKKVLSSYQSGGNLFDAVKGELTFTGYLSADGKLPAQLVNFKEALTKVLDEQKGKSAGRFKVQFVDPDADGGKVGEQIAKDYGFRPMTTSLLSNDSFYFYMTLGNGEQVVQLPVDAMDEKSFRRNLDAGLKHFASGFTKTVALVLPEGGSSYNSYGGSQFSQLEQFLSESMQVKRTELKDGVVPGDADILLLASPQGLSEQQLFAVDQFLMKGGTVVAATSPYSAELSRSSLELADKPSGLEPWLDHFGITIDRQLVMDPQNSAFPMPVTRNVRGFQLQEIRMLDYPYFNDLRGGGLSDHPITAELPQLTIPWASPIHLNADKQGDRKVTELLHSSERAWLSDSTDIMPKVDEYGHSQFVRGPQAGKQLLGVVVEGRFDSYFAGKPSPLLEQSKPGDEKADGKKAEPKKADKLSLGSVIERSPESARLVLISASDLWKDPVLGLLSGAQQSHYLSSLQLAANAIDWSLEDSGLLTIRSRSHFNRTLPPMEHSTQLMWEYLNYGLAALLLLAIGLLARLWRKARYRHYFAQLAG